MKTIRLNELWSQRLAQMPESGMGYQRVDFTLRNQRIIENVMVFNAEECHANEEFDPADVVDVQIHPKS